MTEDPNIKNLDDATEDTERDSYYGCDDDEDYSDETLLY